MCMQFSFVYLKDKGMDAASASPLEEEFTRVSSVASDTIMSLREMAVKAAGGAQKPEEIIVEPENPGPDVTQAAVSTRGIAVRAPDGALDAGSTSSAETIPYPNMSFEGISSAEQFLRFGFESIPQDPVGDVGPDHNVQMVNVALAIYNKADGTLAQPITSLGTIWNGFSVPDCTGNDGDPIVLYDQFEDRWILSQLTAGCDFASTPCYICLAVSETGDPTGGYYRYAIPTQDDPTNTPGGTVFPDYPKYSVWSDSYIITTTDFPSQSNDHVAVSIYALEKSKLITGELRGIHYVINRTGDNVPRIGDGLLPADIDGDELPPPGSPIPIFGNQDDGFYSMPGLTVTDAITILELSVDWTAVVFSLDFKGLLPVESFDSVFPCDPDPFSRGCLPQPGVTDSAQYLDNLTIYLRLLHRLAYRNFGSHESIVATRAVEARDNQAGMRWYEIHRDGDYYTIAQQGTFAPDDGINRWMGSIAQDRVGNIALGYSVVNSGADPASENAVFPGIRYTARLADDPPNVMTLGEANLAIGSGVQLYDGSRWGDYSSMNIDPTDDCTFWYTNEYHTATGQIAGTITWQTRIGSFTLPGCLKDDKGKCSKGSKGSKKSKAGEKARKTRRIRRGLKDERF